MYRNAAILVLPLFLAAVAGPFGYAMSAASVLDASDLYLIVGTRQILHDVFAHPDAREIGLLRAPFAAFLNAGPDFHGLLVDRGYWIFPASALAEICGYGPISRGSS